MVGTCKECTFLTVYKIVANQMIFCTSKQGGCCNPHKLGK